MSAGINMQSFRSPEKESLLKSFKKTAGRKLDKPDSRLKTSPPSLLGLKALLAGIIFILVVSFLSICPVLQSTLTVQVGLLPELQDKPAGKGSYCAMAASTMFCNCLVLL